MKVAILYTGALRSFDKCLPNQIWHVLRHFPGAKFYVATHADEDALKVERLAAFVPPETKVSFEALQQPEMVIPEGCPLTWNGPRSHYMHEPYAISVSPQAVLGQLWMLREGWRLYQESNDPADLIIRIRPDLWFHSFNVPHGIPKKMHMAGYEGDNRMITIGNGIREVAFTPWWGRFGGCNDRFALLGAKAAEAYFTTYDHIPAMIAEGAPLHPETLIHYAMKRKGISICDDMAAEFSTLRKNGEMRPPEILASDIAHYAKP